MRTVLVLSIALLTAGIAPATADAQAPFTIVVDILDYAFGPPSLTVPAGTRVQFVNKDESPHSVVSQDGRTLASPTLSQNQTYATTLAQPGRVAYRCGVHPTMLGEIIVQAP